MDPFTTLRGKIAVLDWSDINTDLIIPARYLKRIERTGYGNLLFADRRYVVGGAPPIDEPESHGSYLPDFPLNWETAKGSSILVVGGNFGCGSSREHAVWAVTQAGYRVVIAPGQGEGFADIFESNAFNNGLLAIELDPVDWEQIVKAGSGSEVTVNLEDQIVTLGRAGWEDSIFRFQVSESVRTRLLHGLDAIAETLLHDSAIRNYEVRLPTWVLAYSIARV